jgi:aminoglycoside phosphotransferase (APT) family kinase protein
MWARGRGWALWKALTTLAGHPGAGSPEAARARREIDAIIADHGHDS